MNYREATKHPMDWIYAHVDPEDRERLSHAFVWIDAGKAGEGESEVTFRAWMGIHWTFGVNRIILWGADALVDSVKDPHGRDVPEKLLLDLKKQLGVTIIPGEYDPLAEPAPVINPVGDPWPEKGPDVYRAIGIEEIPDWTDARGRFLLRSGNQWTVQYFYYVKV